MRSGEAKRFHWTDIDFERQIITLNNPEKGSNPRLRRISFHTFRHWKATMLYHQTKDPYYVKEFLCHKSLKSTEIYITIERTIFEPSNSDEFTVKVVSEPKEIKSLLKVGFEYVCQKDELMFLRKRK